MVIKKNAQNSTSTANGANMTQQMVINFRLIKKSRESDDDMVYIMGSIDELGSWNSDLAPSMICLKPGLWTYSLVIDKNYFEELKKNFQYTFFVAREHPLSGRILSEFWTPSPSQTSMQKRGEMDELFIESVWNEDAPSSPVEPQHEKTPMFYEQAPKSPPQSENRNETISTSPINSVPLHLPFGWYSDQRKQVDENVDDVRNVDDNTVHEFQSEEIRKFEVELSKHEEIRLEDEQFAREQHEKQLRRRLDLLRGEEARISEPDMKSEGSIRDTEPKTEDIGKIKNLAFDEEEEPLLEDDALEKRSQKYAIHDANPMEEKEKNISNKETSEESKLGEIMKSFRMFGLNSFGIAVSLFAIYAAFR